MQPISNLYLGRADVILDIVETFFDVANKLKIPEPLTEQIDVGAKRNIQKPSHQVVSKSTYVINITTTSYSQLT